ncbi:MAG TPA: FAD-binding oxidoreductase [Candidatus Angelobacter sp.]|jgi:glycolate oxidase FAD binding subunit|nr:FAD-binding oxidoreductase [Candidatus Angelobacter sp.]
MSTVTAGASLQRELAGIVGEQNVTQENVSINGVVPACTVTPGLPEEVGAVLAFANAGKFVVAPAGGFTKQDIGGVPERIDILLRTSRLTGIEKYDPGDLTISVRAGTVFADVQSELGKHKQWLPYDPPCLDKATVGGCVATGSAGPLKHTFGGLRDFCIGVQFVTTDGKVVKGGGMVVKNVAGYDLMKLLNGSFGTIGVITRANFKVFPQPRQTQTFVCSFGSLKEALGFRTRIFQSPLTPISLEIISPVAIEYLNATVPAKDPDQYAPSKPVAQPSTNWQLAMRAAGSDNILARYRRELGSAITRELSGADEGQFWRWVTNFEYTVLERHQNAMVIHTHLTIQGLGAALEALEKTAPDYNFVPAVLGRAATGNLVASFVPLSVDPPAAMQYANCVSAFRGMLPAGSSAEVAHCPKEAKPHFDVWGSTPTNIEMMRALKQAIDPNNILNRGRFIV